MQNIGLDLITHLLSIIFFLAASIIVISLYKELKEEKYWIGLPLGIILIFLHELLETLDQIYELSILDIGAEISEVIGAFFIMYASIGLRNILLNVKRTMDEEELENNLEE